MLVQSCVIIEKIIGRKTFWRVGRFLSSWARREGPNDPRTNGEYRVVNETVGWLAKSACDQQIIFFDVGANHGDWSRHLIEESNTLGMNPLVHLFEPSPGQAKTIEHQLQAYMSTGRVVLHRLAVGSKSGNADFCVTGEATGNGTLFNGENIRPDKGSERISVTMVSLDDFVVESLPADTQLCIKCDVEGWDKAVLVGSVELLRRGRVVWFQFEYNYLWIDQRCFLKDIFAIAKETGYSVAKITTDGLEIYEDWHPELERFVEVNYVLIRQDFINVITSKRFQFSSYNVPDPYDPKLIG